MIAIEVIFKEINVLFKNVQRNNLNTINVFRKSMFNSEMNKLWNRSFARVGVVQRVGIPVLNSHIAGTTAKIIPEKTVIASTTSNYSTVNTKSENELSVGMATFSKNNSFVKPVPKPLPIIKNPIQTSPPVVKIESPIQAKPLPAPVPKKKPQVPDDDGISKLEKELESEIKMKRVNRNLPALNTKSLNNHIQQKVIPKEVSNTSVKKLNLEMPIRDEEKNQFELPMKQHLRSRYQGKMEIPLKQTKEKENSVEVPVKINTKNSKELLEDPTEKCKI